MVDPLSNDGAEVRIRIGDGDGRDPVGSGAKRDRARKGQRRRESGVTGLVKRLRRMQTTRTMMKMAAGQIRNVRVAAMGQAALASSTAGGLSRAAGGGVIGAAAAAVAMMSVAAVRGLSGRSFEGMGLEVEKVLLGDDPDEAMAAIEARELISSSGHAMRILGAKGESVEVKEIHDMQRRLSLSRLRGAREIRRQIDVDSTMDLLALRLWEAMKAAVAPEETKLTRALRMIRYMATRDPIGGSASLGLKIGVMIGRSLAANR